MTAKGPDAAKEGVAPAVRFILENSMAPIILTELAASPDACGLSLSEIVAKVDPRYSRDPQKLADAKATLSEMASLEIVERAERSPPRYSLSSSGHQAHRALNALLREIQCYEPTQTRAEALQMAREALRTGTA